MTSVLIFICGSFLGSIVTFFAIAIVISGKDTTYSQEETSDRKVYICGPTSGYNYQERCCVFNSIEQKLKKKGSDVFNPLKNGLDKNAREQQHMKVDIENLAKCDYIIFLPNWDTSYHCRLERNIANCCCIKNITMESIQY